jgi:mono/diheme cytochrome c family protein
MSAPHLAVLTLLLGLGGCRGAPTQEEPVVPIRNMHQQPRYNAQGSSVFFSDGRAMRPLVPHTVAQEMEPELEVETGWSDDRQTWVLTIPVPVVDGFGGMAELVARGQDRYDIYCSACHGFAGDGDGAVAQRAGGPISPPTYHADAIRRMPDGQMFATISRGVRNMPAHGHSIPPRDRWAIVGYVRALQLSQAQAPQAMNLAVPR